MKYFYENVYVTKVYDGDTITVDIDFGMDVCLKNLKIRLYGIDSPELRGKDKEIGKVSRDFLKSLILKKTIVLETIKDKKGKYGRYLGIVYLKDEQDNLINVNELLIKEGMAKRYEL